MNIHLMPNEKFIPTFIDMCQKKLPEFNNLFFISSNRYGKNSKNILSKNVIYEDDVSSFYFYKKISQHLDNSNVFLHGMFDIKYILLLIYFQKKKFKLHWLIWGGDLYSIGKSTNIKTFLRDVFKKNLMRRVDSVVSKVLGDFKNAAKYLSSAAEFNECLMYTSNTFDQKHSYIFESKRENSLAIQVGNSADPENNHEIAFRILKEKTDQGKSFKIYCPLTYGNLEYAKEVIQMGYEFFGSAFIPISDHMPLEEYLNYLSTIDIAIFPHNRQQAMGNIINLLGLGKKVYLSRDVTTYELFLKYEVDVMDINEFKFEPISEYSSQKNIDAISKHFTYPKLVSDWRSIFEKYNENSI